MNIYTFKNQLEQIVKPAPSHALVEAEQAWAHFKAAMKERLDEEACEEFGFSMSYAAFRDGVQVHHDQNLFQIYFGRLIDAQKNHPWHTAEINFYYRFEMTANLRRFVSALQPQEIETAFCWGEDEDTVSQKIQSVFAFSDRQQLIWDEIRELKPVQAGFHFWIQ